MISEHTMPEIATIVIDEVHALRVLNAELVEASMRVLTLVGSGKHQASMTFDPVEFRAAIANLAKATS